MKQKLCKFVLTCTSAILCSTTMAADVVVGVGNWPSANVSGEVIKNVLENNLGIEVELQPGTNPIIFEAMSKGSMHVHSEVWLPNQANLADEFSDSVVQNLNSAATAQGMCSNQAARDAGINHIIDLTNADLTKIFDRDGNGKGEIYIGATGWASTTVEKVKAKSYGYDLVMDLQELDETLAYAELDDANNKGEPWVGFCYEPHHLFVVHPDLEFIEEPAHDADKWLILQPDQDPEWLEKSFAGMAWPSATVQLFFAKSLQQDLPEAASVLANFALTSDDLSGFSYKMVVDSKEPSQIAQEWVDENQDRVSKWLQ